MTAPARPLTAPALSPAYRTGRRPHPPARPSDPDRTYDRKPTITAGVVKKT
ncbi:hypothetical protein [Streptomyces sp. NPDC056463]|uniref:hypothetical protein n=1 Tax=unclassified Streptomyces TaxID=2593676 RepID=UPI003685C2C2